VYKEVDKDPTYLCSTPTTFLASNVGQADCEKTTASRTRYALRTSLERAFQTLKRGGVLVSTVNPPSPEKAKEFDVTVAMVVTMPKPDQLAEINRLLESGRLKMRVAKVLPLEGVKQAHQLSASGHADGKIILRP